MLKDMRHALDEARSTGADFSLAERAEELYAAAAAAGHSDDDFAAVAEAVRALTPRR
jgi:3-hydroxyisobutyrate dehydrogenase-like beta-hydroxyacid dehydrogenase